ncbi:hypothetical protein CR513_57198, partial [Mucuna pruriens]
MKPMWKKNIYVDKLEGIVGHIMVNNHLTFSNEEIPMEGRGNKRALNIFVNSSLNVLPKATLERLPYGKARVRNSSIIVRAFDGSRRKVMGEIEILVQINPFEFQISFQTLDPFHWSSPILSQHQKLKFIVGDKLVIIFGEEDLVVTCPKPAGYIEAAKEDLTAFQSLKLPTPPLQGKAKREMS